MQQLLPLAQRVATARGWDNQLRELMQLGASLSPLDERFRQDHYLVAGCDTQVWLITPTEGDSGRWMGDATSRVMRGVLAVLLEFANHKGTDKLPGDYYHYIEMARLTGYLSASRRHGIQQLIARLSLA